MALQPLALHLLGVESPPGRRPNGREGERTADARPPRPSRRTTSYYNTFQTSCTTSTDDPPSYETASRQRPAQSRPSESGKETLPCYTCTVTAEAKVLLNIESVSPLHDIIATEFREAYLVLRGTLLSIHKAKDNRPGKLLRSYTLQHAEVGLAPDVHHATLEPRTKLARVIPSAGRRRAWLKDPDMFEVVPQYAMRLRLETDQIVLASPSEEQIHALINAICAGIDVSCSIDERSIPRQCTVPRRRRRHRPQQPANLQDPSLLAEQERILRDMYPGFAERTGGSGRPELGRTITTITAGTANTTSEPLPTPAREEDEIDLSAMREEEEERPSTASPTTSPRRPHFMRSITDTSVNTTFSGDMIYATSPENFRSDTGKWQPPHTRTPQQIHRYIKRCLPILPPQATRASDILICNGKRVRVNLRMEMLEAWELAPPSYKSHHFGKTVRPSSEEEEEEEEDGTAEQRSQNSGLAAEHSAPQTSTSVLGVENEAEADDQITRAAEENGLASLELAKVTSLSGTDKGVVAERPASQARTAAAKRQEEREHGGGEMHGVVFCF